MSFKILCGDLFPIGVDMNFAELSLYMAPVVGITAVIIGVGAVLKPHQMAENFGISASGSASSYVVSLGIRDVFVGLTVLILYFNQAWRELGLIQFCIGLVAISDFLVVLKKGNKIISLIHLAGAFVVTAYGMWLLFLF